MKPGKYSLGTGDRFGHQGSAQLKAVTMASETGIDITPVWNKSNREHMITGTVPGEVRKDADRAVREAGFTKQYLVDADHINLDTVDPFINCSDFFTIDVASRIGSRAPDADIRNFISEASAYKGIIHFEGTGESVTVSDGLLIRISEKYLAAAIEAGAIYSKIESQKGKCNFVTEVSMDEVENPQSPAELFFILMMLSMQGVPVQTIAPRFTGRFNKGVDYAGDLTEFAKEFEADILVIKKAVAEFGLPADLKLSVHSGSDKFSIYPIIGRLIKKHDAGIHIKTAGTTWLEEIAGLASSGGEGFRFARELCIEALSRKDDLIKPYREVTDIDYKLLPAKEEIQKWDKMRLTESLTHDSSNGFYNPALRQLIHVAYKLAAERKEEYFRLLDLNKEVTGARVTHNLFENHILRIFGD